MMAAKTATVVFVVLVAQLAFFVDVRVFGVAPELLALVAMLAGLLAGPERGATIAFCAGLVYDVWLPTPLGLAAMSFAIVAFAIGSVESGLFHDSRLKVVGLAAVGTAAAVVGFAFFGEVVGQRGMVDVELLRVASIAGAINGLLAPLMVRPMRWAVSGVEISRAAAPVRG